MGITAAQLIAKVSAEGVDQAKQQIQSVGEAADKSSGRSGGGGLMGLLQSGLNLAGTLGIANAVAGGFSFLKDQIGSIFEQAASQQNVMAQTAQVIKSTGGAAGLSADQIGNYADKMATLTRFSDDSIQSSENVLLTFTDIGKNVFPTAENAILDVSQAMGEDLQSATVQVGKAINDPLTGMTALQRIGVTFNDTQKETIKQMMATGNTAGAQAIILNELGKEFGGSATAAGKTFAGGLQIAQNELDQAKEKIGTALLPMLTQLAQTVLGVALPALQGFSTWFTSDAAPALNQFGTFINANILPTLSTLGNFVTGTVVPAMVSFANFVSVNILPTLENFGSWIMTRVVPALIQMYTWFNANILPVLSQLAAIAVQTVFPALQKIGDVIFQQVLPPVEAIIGKVAPILIPVFQKMGDILNTVVVPALQIVGNIIAGVATGISTLIDWIKSVIDWFGSLGDKASKALNNVKSQVNNIPVIGGIANWAGFASGTDSVPQSGIYKVGERGEELVYLPKGSAVVPNSDIGNAPAYTGGAGGGSSIIIYLDSKVLASAMLPAMAGTIRIRTGQRSA